MRLALFRVSFCVLAACACLTASTQAAPFLPVPPGSFINYHVDTVQQLSRQVKIDASVSGRLARHFHMPTQSVETYLQNNLILTRLSKSEDYRVWCVTPSGREYTIREHLLAGTPVFALASTHQPIFKRVCGNPLVATLPHIEAKRLPPPLAPPVLVSKPTAHAAVTPVSELALLPHENVVATGLMGTSVAGPLVKVESYSAVFNKAGSNLLRPALALFGLALFSGGGSGNGSVISTKIGPGGPSGGSPSGPIIGPAGGPSNSPIPVPEPSPAMTVILTGLFLVILLVRASQRPRLARVLIRMRRRR